jgi:biotin carboxyl carrier protein
VKYFVTLPSGRERVVDLVEDAKGRTVVVVDGDVVEADVVAPATSGTATSIRVDGKQVELWLEPQRDPGSRLASTDYGVIANGRRFFAKVESERSRIQAAAKPASGGEGAVRSPMPGRVVRLLVAEGADVEAGAPVVVVEAMKMENELAAGRAGKVTKIHVAAGAAVESGALLVEVG